MSTFAIWRPDLESRDEARTYLAFEAKEAVLKHAAHCHALDGAQWSWPVAFYVVNDDARETAARPTVWREFVVDREAVPRFHANDGKVVQR